MIEYVMRKDRAHMSEKELAPIVKETSDYVRNCACGMHRLEREMFIEMMLDAMNEWQYEQNEPE